MQNKVRIISLIGKENFKYVGILKLQIYGNIKTSNMWEY